MPPPPVPPPRGVVAIALFELAAFAAAASAACCCLAISAAAAASARRSRSCSIATPSSASAAASFCSYSACSCSASASLASSVATRSATCCCLRLERRLFLGQIVGQRRAARRCFQHRCRVRADSNESFCSASVYARRWRTAGSSSSAPPETNLSTAMLPSTSGQLAEASLLARRCGPATSAISLIELGLLVLRRAVVLVELAEPLLEVVELVGELLDLGLLVIDTVGADNGRLMTAGCRPRSRPRHIEEDGCPWTACVSQPTNCYERMSKPLRKGDLRAPIGLLRRYSHSMVPGGFDVMS